jgi:hypothetical protein
MTDISCEALVVHCMDYRLQKSLNDWLDKNPARDIMIESQLRVEFSIFILC